jgi:hypothetical protein
MDQKHRGVLDEDRSETRTTMNATNIILSTISIVLGFMAGVHFSTLVGIRVEARRAADQLNRIANRLDHGGPL